MICSIGHKYLFSKGILHRDISAGNIMLSSLANPRPGMEGFLMDLEYARLDSIAEISTMKSEAKTPGATQTVFKDARRGAEMTVSSRDIIINQLTSSSIGHSSIYGRRNLGGFA